MSTPPLAHAPLGHDVVYPGAYDASLLFPVPRHVNRQTLTPLPSPWFGSDIWTAYELSWLNSKGKPQVALGRFEFAHTSPHLIESKSLKLYLNSLNEESFASVDAYQATVQRDLSQAAGDTVNVQITPLSQAETLPVAPLSGHCIDALDIAIDRYEPAPDLLACVPGAAPVTETLVSNLLKSNCPVTGQPDWGSVQIRYTGPAIDRAALLRYIVSLRRHTEFHEHCVEKMFCDIRRACGPQELFVYARYTRRGGLDINPWRSSTMATPAETRTPRQ